MAVTTPDKVSYVCRRCDGGIRYIRRTHIYRHIRRGSDHAPIPVVIAAPMVELIGDAPGEHEHDGGPMSELELRYYYGDR